MRHAPLAKAALAVAALSLTAAACEPSTDGITTGDVRRATVTEVVDVPASVTAKAVATLTAPADGTLARLTVEPGARVRPGAIVAVVDSPSARKRLADAKAALSAASGIGVSGGSVNLAGLQRSLDAAATDAFAAARAAAGQIADDKVRTALLAQLTAAQKHYAAAAAQSKKVLSALQRGLAGIGDAVAALGAAQRAQAQAAYDLAKSSVDALTMRAPIAGVVQLAGPSTGGSADPLAGLLDAVGGGGAAASSASTANSPTVAGVDDVLGVGDRVNAGAAIVTIVDVSEIGLVGEVDETDVLLVSAGVTASVELDAAPGTPYEATVRTIDLLPTPSARGGVAYRVRLAFAPVSTGQSAPPTPRPGMSAVAHLRVRTATDAVAVPASAVFTSDLGDTVWVLGPEGAARQKVTVGVQGEDLVQIVSGLQVGQRVVVSGTDRVSVGQELS